MRFFLWNKIVEGVYTPVGLFSFMALIIGNNLGNEFICGGSYLGNKTVISAGHCFMNGIPASNYTLHFMEQVVDGVYETKTSRKVVSYQVHPKHTHSNYTHDVAVINIDQDLDIDNAIVYNDKKCYNDLEKVGTNLTIVGYGTTKPPYLRGGIFGLSLHRGNVYIVDKKDYYLITDDTMILAKGYNDDDDNHITDACYGDSGSPLLSNNIIVGLTSWGIACGLPNYPGVYSKISSSLDWLSDKIPTTKC